MPGWVEAYSLAFAKDLLRRSSRVAMGSEDNVIYVYVCEGEEYAGTSQTLKKQFNMELYVCIYAYSVERKWDICDGFFF